MTRYFSIYLDLVRFVAACLVVVYHASIPRIVTGEVPLSSYGHGAVIVFFVLSGFVIAYVSHEKEPTPADYWSSRLSRIYSLAIPAVLLTPVLDTIGESVNYAMYADQTTHDFWYVRIVSSLFFLNEIWDFSILSFSNVPYWSLCYEMWYYILYGVWRFASGKWRTAFLILIALLLGPKILLLAPIWLLGVALYHAALHVKLPEWAGWSLLVLSIAFAVAFDRLHAAALLSQPVQSLTGPYWFRELAFSRFFLSDWLLGLIVFAHFMSVRCVAHRFGAILTRLEPLARTLSGYTFSIYIFHRPLLLFWAALIAGSPDGYGFWAAVVGATAVSVAFLGFLTEKRRYLLRRALRDFLTAIPAARVPAR